MFVANPTLGVNTVQELISKAKGAPGQLSFAVAGIGTAGHLAMELFKANAGIDIKAINYKGDTPALADTIAGHVQVMMATVVAASPHVASGKLKALAVTAPKLSAPIEY
jgi:tripartite-type tricarboxylate transporter receptor subunit TctC